MENESMVFYQSFYESIKNFSTEEFKDAASALLEYGLYGIIPECDGIVETIFILAKPQIDANIKRRSDGNKGGRPSKKNEQEPVVNQTETILEPMDNHRITEQKPVVNETETTQEPMDNHRIVEQKPNVNVNANVNANVNDIKRESREKNSRFSPPTEQDVAEYCREKGYNNFDVARFVDHYTSNGWMVGKNKMKDWKAAVRKWVRSELDTKPNNTKGNKFNNFNQRNYDYDELEKQLLSTDACQIGD